MVVLHLCATMWRFCGLTFCIKFGLRRVAQRRREDLLDDGVFELAQGRGWRGRLADIGVALVDLHMVDVLDVLQQVPRRAVD